MPKITELDNNSPQTIKVKTSDKADARRGYRWWLQPEEEVRGTEMLDTAVFLKEMQQYRYRQASTYARMYSNMPLFNFVGTNMQKMSLGNNLPIDRPTMNVTQSCIDTLVSRISQARPRPVFLTDNGDYKQRNLAKQLNSFIGGEFHQTQAYALGELMLRDACVLGTGCLKIYEKDGKVCLDRVLLTELLVDMNDSLYGSPRCLYQFKLVDRSMLKEAFPKEHSVVSESEQAFPDNSDESSRTTSDQIMVVEGWHLPSGKDSKDGRHLIATTAGVLLDEEWTQDKFPFVFLQYSPRVLGFWGQSLAEQLMGTQIEINKLLMTISAAINLVGVPRVFVEDGSKVMKTSLNSSIGAIVTYRGTKPQYEVAPCIPQEVYAQLQRLVDYAYQQSGISQLSAASQKPAGIDSGAALREYDDLQSDRFAALVRRYDSMYIELAYQIIELARSIAERDGKYQTVYPNKNGVKEIDLPLARLLNDPFVIQCFDASSLPRDPAGRLQKITEMMQAGLVTPQEGRRLLDYPDLEQEEILANAGEERILKILDQIVNDGKYTPPDPFMDLGLATQLVTQYYNLYSESKLTDERAEMLRSFFVQIQGLKAEAMQASMPQQQPQQGQPMAQPQAAPQSNIVPFSTVSGQ